jgi:hypothetical protein
MNLPAQRIFAMSAPYDLPGFGDYLLDPDLLASYRARLRQLGQANTAHADLPRLVTIWRDDPDSSQRGHWSARQVKSWLETKSQQSTDYEDFQMLAGAFFRERSS